MTPERWKQINELFIAALEQSPLQRSAFLEQSCGNDESLRKEVADLLAAYDRPNHPIDRPVYEAAANLIASGGALSVVGRVIGNYSIEREIGRGGMGEVFLARDLRLDRLVAVKMLPADSTADSDRVRRFRQEARAVSALNHPNIVTIHEIGETEGLLYIVTEYIEGKTLREHMSKGRMKLAQILDIAAQATTALSAAHKAGIVHRDIKPENIMLREDGYVKVLDFGLAKLTERRGLDGDDLVTTRQGVIMGTTRYMSPEQARGQKTDARSDIFSFGVMLYEMAAGRAPFDGETNSDVLAAVLTKEAPPLSEFAEGAPVKLERIVSKSIRKRIDDRYQTIEELLGDIKKLKEELDFQTLLQGNAQEAISSGASEESRLPNQSPTYIAPVPTSPARPQATSTAEYLISAIKEHKKSLAAILSLIIVLGLVGGLYTWTVPAAKKRLSFDNMRTEKLTTDSNAFYGVISPDGKYVAYVAELPNGLGLQIRQVTTGSELQLVPPADVQYWNITFSHDSNFVYYIIEDNKNPTGGTLYKMPALGGASQKLKEKLGTFTLSPDDKQFAFVRVDYSREESDLMTADISGEGEKALAVRKLPDVFIGTSWSPDGKLIAAGVINHSSGDHQVYMVGVPSSGGPETTLTAQRWPVVTTFAWLPDGSGLIVNAREQGSEINRLWRLSYPDGAAQIITNDSYGYHGASLTADGSVLATSMGYMLANIWTAPSGDLSRAKKLTSGFGIYGQITCMPDGKILFTRGTNEGEHICIMDPDGGGRKQLTFGRNRNSAPEISPDGRYIVFASNRSGNFCIWRMDSDGGNLKQLTNGSRDAYPKCSPDGKWVYYISEGRLDPMMSRVPLEGGEEIQLGETGIKTKHDISPDGKHIAYEFYDKGTLKGGVAVRPVDWGPVEKTFDFKPVLSIRWSRDGQGLTYFVNSGNGSELWYQPIAGGRAKRLTTVEEDNLLWFDWSRDGKQLIYVRGRITSDVILMNSAK